MKEAAFQLWEEHVRGVVGQSEASESRVRRRDVEPNEWLRLAADLEHTPAVDELRRWDRAATKKPKKKKKKKRRGGRGDANSG